MRRAGIKVNPFLFSFRPHPTTPFHPKDPYIIGVVNRREFKTNGLILNSRNGFFLFVFRTIFRTILDQLEAHEEAWPFLLPVNTKQFPTYKKIIRSPMDLSTIRKKLNDNV